MRPLALLVSFLAAGSVAADSPVAILGLYETGAEFEVRAGEPVFGQVPGDSTAAFAIGIAGFDRNFSPGAPCLPVKAIALAIPSDARPRITILEKRARELHVPWADAHFPALEHFPEPVRIGLTGFVRDLRVIQVLVQPVVPSGRGFVFHDYVRFRVDYASAAGTSAKAEASADPVDPLLRSLVVNPTDISRFKKGREWKSESSSLLQVPLERYKMSVKSEGIYRVTGSEMRKGGMDLSGIDPRMLHLENMGAPVPYYLHGCEDGTLDDDDYMEFYGEAPRGGYTFLNLYTRENIYWLYSADSLGLPLVEEDGGLVETDPARLEAPTSYDWTVHSETDNWFERLPGDTASEEDVWFWDMISASEQGIKTFGIELPGRDPSSYDTVDLYLGLQGLTHYASLNPDHHCLIYLNQVLAGGVFWDGQHSRIFSSKEDGTAIENHALLEKDNSVSIVMPGDTPAGSDDRVLLNWIEVTYRRLYAAHGDYIRFAKPGDGRNGLYQFTVEGFTTPDISVYKLGKSRIVNLTVKPVILFGDTSYSAVFQTEIVSDRVEFVALTEKARKRVESFSSDEPSSLRSSLNSADIIVIAHDSLAAAAASYVDLRGSQGARVRLVRTSDVYDEFNWGLRDASAVRDFLKFAYERWAPPAFTACVLLGDASSDERDLAGMGGNLIPIHLERSIYSGLVASDNWYACISGDDFLPDVVVSRIPATKSEEVSAVVEKLEACSSRANLGPWKTRVLHVAGQGGSSTVTFRSLMNDSILETQMPLWAEPRRVYAQRIPGVDPDPYYGGRSDVLECLGEGVSVAQYLGHGSGGTWSSPYLLTPEDVPGLQNEGRLPLVASFTCFTCVFDQPTRHSLGEALVLEPGKGASGIMGTTALGYFWEDVHMARSFNRTIYDNLTERTIGDVFLHTKLSYALENYGGYAATMVKCQTLLGDPAAPFELPSALLDVSPMPRSVEQGDSVTVHVDASGPEVDSALVVLSDSASSFALLAVPVVNGQGRAAFEIPQGVKPGMAISRAYAWNASSGEDMAGGGELGISSPAVFLVRTVPASPGPWDSVHVEAGVHYAAGIDSVILFWARSRKPSTWNRIPMFPAAGDTFRTEATIPPQEPGRTVCYKVAAFGTDGKTFESKIRSFPALAKPNILLLRPEDVALGGTRTVCLTANLFNSGDVGVDSCPVLFRSYPDSAIMGEGWASVPPLSYGEASAAWSPTASSFRIFVEIDPDNIVDESMESDNSSIGFPTRILVNMFSVTREAGTGGWVATPDSNLVARIPPEAVQDSSVLVVQEVAPHAVCQPGIRFAALPRRAMGQAYALSFADESSILVPGATFDVALRYDESDTLNARQLSLLSVYGYDRESGKWKKRGGSADSSRVEHSADTLGEYAVMASEDGDPPAIKFSVKDQSFASGDFVPPNPTVFFLLTDENGIDAEKGIALTLDGVQVDPRDYVFPREPADGNEVQASYCPRLGDGPHTISVACWDCVGNRAAMELTVTVQAEFAVECLANYPNPVRSDETVFAFVLTGAAHEAELKIYTPSGRLVRAFTRGRWWDLKEIGYHEVPWDLRDEDGFPVANGVYFYVLSAEKEGKSVNERRKLAVLR